MELAAQSTSHEKALTIEPINFLLNGILNVKYEQKLSQVNSYTAGGLMVYDSRSEGTWLGFGVNGSYRWYFDLFKTRKKPLEGFSLGPKASIVYMTFNPNVNKGDIESTAILAIGGEAQYKWVWDQFVLETGFELAFPLFGTNDFPYYSFGLNAGLGYAW